LSERWKSAQGAESRHQFTDSVYGVINLQFTSPPSRQTAGVSQEFVQQALWVGQCLKALDIRKV
jgi:hypothetical protein